LDVGRLDICGCKDKYRKDGTERENLHDYAYGTESYTRAGGYLPSQTPTTSLDLSQGKDANKNANNAGDPASQPTEQKETEQLNPIAKRSFPFGGRHYTGIERRIACLLPKDNPQGIRHNQENNSCNSGDETERCLGDFLLTFELTGWWYSVAHIAL
jgi:hypothetical protein